MHACAYTHGKKEVESDRHITERWIRIARFHRFTKKGSTFQEENSTEIWNLKELLLIGNSTVVLNCRDCSYTEKRIGLTTWCNYISGWAIIHCKELSSQDEDRVWKPERFLMRHKETRDRLHPLWFCGVGLLIPVYQMEKLRHNEIKNLCGHSSKFYDQSGFALN